MDNPTNSIVSSLKSPAFREALESDEQGRQWIQEARDFKAAHDAKTGQPVKPPLGSAPYFATDAPQCQSWGPCGDGVTRRCFKAEGHTDPHTYENSVTYWAQRTTG